MPHRFAGLLSAIAMLLAWTPVARATPVMSMSVGGVILSNPSGQVVDTIASGPFKGSLLIGAGAPFSGSDLNPQIDLDGVVKAGAAGTLVVKVTETGITTSFPLWAFDSEFSGTLAKNLKVTFATYADASDTAFGTSNPLASAMFSATGSFSNIQNLLIGPPFSITEIATLTASGSSSQVSNFDASLSGSDALVPEPATMVLLGTGALGLGAVLRRKSR